MHAQIRTVALAAIVSFALLPVAAHADGPIAMPVEGATGTIMYVLPDAGYQTQNMPKFQTGSTAFGSGTPFFTNSPHATGGAGGLTAGFFLPSGWPQFGQNARLELSADFFDLNDATSNNYPGGTAFGSQWVYIGGQSFTSATDGVYGNTLKTEYQGFELALRAATDIQAMPNLSVTPAVAIFGGNSYGTFDYGDVEQCTTPGCFFEYSREAVRTYRFGSTVSLGARSPIGAGFAVIGGVSGSLYGAWSHLSGNDCYSVTAGLSCDSAGHVESFVSNSKGTAGGRLGAQAGLQYNPGWMAVGLIGGFSWDSAVPGVANPVAAGQTAVVNYSDELAYSIRLQFTFPFGGSR
jgi:hypothetical protein